MARLTILQASQQGFGSTLTIHRHIKEGSLPIYEEGDVKLLEVDDLISLLGEPGAVTGASVIGEQTAAAVDRIDIYEYNRMKSELDQKNKKNMWLAADLAEVVRELKEKEVKFHAERDRLLKILEQAQALLLREAKRAGGGLKTADGPALTLDQVTADGDPDALAQRQASLMPDLSIEQPPRPGEEDTVAVSTPETGISEMVSETHTDTLFDPPSIIVKDENRPEKTAKSRNRMNPVNPLIPPLEDATDEPRKSRLMGTTTWILLFTLVGCGLVFFKFRTKIMSSIEHVMQTLGYM